MKILNVCYSLGKGGTERAAQNFALGHARNGHDSRYLYTSIDGIRRKILLENKIPVYSLTDESACIEVAQWQPDIVHLHSHNVSIEDYKKIKIIAPYAKYIETNVFSHPSPWVDDLDISLQLSYWCDWLYKNRSKSKYKSAVVPYPVDTSAFQRSQEFDIKQFRSKYGIAENEILIGRVGQNYIAKWSPLLIDTFEILRQSNDNLKLLVVNPPDSILQRINNSRFKESIIHIEQIIGDAELANCYSSIDIFVLIAEIGESFGMVLAEALLCETPVVTLATPWADNSQGEVVGNQVGGFVAANKKDLCGLITKLADDKSLREKFGAAGRQRIIDNFDLQKVSRQALTAVDSNMHNYKLKKPLELMKLTEGRLNYFTQAILSLGKFFIILRYSTGYQIIPRTVRNRLNFLLCRFDRYKKILTAEKKIT